MRDYGSIYLFIIMQYIVYVYIFYINYYEFYTYEDHRKKHFNVILSLNNSILMTQLTIAYKTFINSTKSVTTLLLQSYEILSDK